jgi:hypothetical protein
LAATGGNKALEKIRVGRANGRIEQNSIVDFSLAMI